MWVDQSESWFPAKHAHVRRHQTQHILCQQRLSYLRSTSNYFLVVAWFFYFFIEKADFFSKIQTFWRKRRPYLCVFFKKVLFADQSPLKRTQLVSLASFESLMRRWRGILRFVSQATRCNKPDLRRDMRDIQVYTRGEPKLSWLHCPCHINCPCNCMPRDMILVRRIRGKIWSKAQHLYLLYHVIV